jgi:hypothetical protein
VSGLTSPPLSKSSRSVGELDDLLGMPSKPSPKKETSSLDRLLEASRDAKAEKEQLSRLDIQRGMNRVSAEVKKCGNGSAMSVVVAVSILRTGKVSNAVATGSFAGSDTGRCVAKAVRDARFPRASRDITVKYTFTL